MKITTMIIRYKQTALAVMGALLLFSCHDLDMAPLSKGTSDTWYRDESEVKAAVNQLYDAKYWTWAVGCCNDDVGQQFSGGDL